MRSARGPRNSVNVLRSRIRSNEPNPKRITVLEPIGWDCYIPLVQGDTMQDRITNLCKKLLNAQQPTDVAPTAEQLRLAIAEKVRSIRAEAQDVALKLLYEHRETLPQDQPVTFEADHVHRRQHEPSDQISLA